MLAKGITEHVQKITTSNGEGKCCNGSGKILICFFFVIIMYSTCNKHGDAGYFCSCRDSARLGERYNVFFVFPLCDWLQHLSTK